MESNKVASGGVVKRQGLTSKLTHTFTESGDFVVHRPVIIRYLIVGGRGGGPTKDTKAVYNGAKLNTIDQEGKLGEIVEGTSTYQLKPGTYRITVGKRNTEFTLKQIAGTAKDSSYRGTIKQDCQYGSGGRPLYDFANRQVAWTAYKREFKKGNPSSIQGISTARGGSPHTGITDQPSTEHRPSNTGYVDAGIHQRNPGGATPLCAKNYWENPLWGFPISGGVWYMHNDKVWKDPYRFNDGSSKSQKESDITGTKAMYGLKPMVIITYDENQAGPVPTTPAPTTPAPTTPAPTTPAPTTPAPGPTQEEIDRIVKEYEEKMAQLRAAAEAEKRALQVQNAAAAEQARQIQEQLVRDLTALKAQYEQMKAAAETATNDLQTAKQELEAIKTSYDEKMAALAAAQKAELDALNAKNTAAVNEARAVQQQLVAEMTALKAQYDALVAQAAECPTIPEGAIVVDGKDGQLYKWDMAALRPMSTDTYRALGSPGYTTFPSGKLDQCPRGPVVVIETAAPTTPAPSTPPGPSDQTFPNTLYILVHAESWSEKGELKVLASRFGGATIEPFQYKALEQVFAINNNGYIRNLEGAGPYLASHEDCLAPIMSKETPKTGWKIQKTGESKYGYRLVSTCGTSLSASVGAREPMLEKPSIGVTDVWYILPVGSADF